MRPPVWDTGNGRIKIGSNNNLIGVRIAAQGQFQIATSNMMKGTYGKSGIVDWVIGTNNIISGCRAGTDMAERMTAGVRPRMVR